MTQKSETIAADRRNFLKLAGASAVGVGGVVAGTTAAPAPVRAEAGSKAASNDLYQESAHVKRYYELAR